MEKKMEHIELHGQETAAMQTDADALRTEERGKFSELLYKKSFIARLILADDELKQHYSELKNEMMTYLGVKSRVSWAQETFRAGQKTLLRMKIRGKMLCLYYALPPREYEGTKYGVEDVSSTSRNGDAPMLYRIKSGLRCRYAKDLIADVCGKHGLERGEARLEDYVSTCQYESIETLMQKGLVKPTGKIAARRGNK